MLLHWLPASCLLAAQRRAGLLHCLPELSSLGSHQLVSCRLQLRAQLNCLLAAESLPASLLRLLGRCWAVAAVSQRCLAAASCTAGIARPGLPAAQAGGACITTCASACAGCLQQLLQAQRTDTASLADPSPIWQRHQVSRAAHLRLTGAIQSRTVSCGECRDTATCTADRAHSCLSSGTRPTVETVVCTEGQGQPEPCSCTQHCQPGQ